MIEWRQSRISGAQSQVRLDVVGCKLENSKLGLGHHVAGFVLSRFLRLDNSLGLVEQLLRGNQLGLARVGVQTLPMSGFDNIS